MANLEQVERLKQSVTGWNAWRQENPDVQPDLVGTNLNGADMRYANLSHTDLSSARLRGAKLSYANLNYVKLSSAKLHEADLNHALFWGTTLLNIDLRTTKGLAGISHRGPFPIHLPSVHLPEGGSALHFLRGVGLPDEYIETWRTTMLSPIQYHSVFISCPSTDEFLARRLHADLQAQGVWY